MTQEITELQERIKQLQSETYELIKKSHELETVESEKEIGIKRGDDCLCCGKRAKLIKRDRWGYWIVTLYKINGELGVINKTIINEHNLSPLT